MAAAALVAAAVAFAVPAPARAKSFRIAAVQVEAEVRPDASMHVVEHITYDFDGEFHNGHRTIPRGDYRIVEVGVRDRDAGRPAPFEGDGYDLTWHFDARDEQRTFDISYTVVGAVKVGPDVGELYWKFVGSDHPGIGRVAVEVDLPGEGLDVRAWAHGPLNGLVEPSGPQVRASVEEVPAGEFVELRVTQPASDFTVTPEGGDRLPSVLAEEERLADEANAQRARAAEAERRRERIEDALGALVPVLAVGAWVLFFVLWVRYGREHRAPEDVGEYLRELPHDPPAFVGMLREWGSVTPSVLSATLVDLAQRGHLTIEELRADRLILPDKVDWRFTAPTPTTPLPAGGDPLRPFEATILARLFASGSTTTHSEFTAWCRAHRTSAQRWWEDVKSELRAEFKARGYIEGGRGLVYAANVLAGLAVAALGVAAAATGALPPALGVAIFFSGLVQTFLTPVLRRRTPAGRRRLAEWAAVERFLRDFSELEDAPVGHVVLWERYLVYAVALGVTAAVARALAARIPAEAAASGGFAPWYIGPHGPGALDSIGSLSDFASSVGPAIVASATPQSSSSSGGGGGGGFSGGGGGGGGGGGIGAS